MQFGEFVSLITLKIKFKNWIMQSSEFVSWLTLKIKFKKIKELLKATEIDLH